MRKRQSLRQALCFFILIFQIALMQAQDDQVVDMLMQRQDYQSALTLLKEQDSSFNQQVVMGKCYHRLGQWRQAKVTIEGYLKQDTFHTGGNIALASIYDQEFNMPKAIKHYRRLVKSDDQNPTFLKNLAQAHVKANLLRLADELFWQARMLNPQDISILLSLTDLAFRDKNWLLADSLTNLGMQLDSSNFQLILAKARCKYTVKNYLESVHFLKKAKGWIDLNPYYQKMLGYGLLQIDSLDESIHVLENLLYQEESEHTHFYLALAYQKKSNSERSIHHYEKAIEKGISGNIGKYYAGLARQFKRENKLKDAIIAYGEAWDYVGNPSHLFQKAQLSEQYYKDKSIALAEYRKCIKYKSLRTDELAFAADRIRLLKEYLHQSSN